MPFVLEFDVQFSENELRTDYEKETWFSACQLIVDNKDNQFELSVAMESSWCDIWCAAIICFEEKFGVHGATMLMCQKKFFFCENEMIGSLYGDIT